MLTITQMLGAPTGSTADPIGLGETLESPTRTIADLVDRTGKLTKRPLILVGDSNEVHKSTAELHAESSAQLHRTQSQERAKESIPTLLDDLSGLGFSWRDIARVVGEFVRQVFAAALRGSVRTVARARSRLSSVGIRDRPLAANESWAIVNAHLGGVGASGIVDHLDIRRSGTLTISVERSTARSEPPAFPSPTRLGDVAFVSMKRAEAERRMKALVDFHSAVGEVLRLTDFADDGLGRQAVRPKPGREQEWHAAKSKADRLVAAAARSFDAVGASISYNPRGTWDQYPINPASTWETVLKDDPMYDASLLDTMTNQAIGAYESLVDDPPKRQRVRIEGFSFPGWVAGVLAGVVATVIGGGILYWLGWVG